MTELGRVLDPDELRDEAGRVGRWSVDVPDDWLGEGETIEVVVPTLVNCARCDGGGCDACERSGAFRLELDEAERTISLTLPGAAEKRAVTIRIARPFGSDATLDQLLLEIRASDRPSASCRKLPRARSGTNESENPSSSILGDPITLALLIVLAIAIAALVASKR